ncbi:MAG TPA: hypothetical protein ACHBX0_05010 [Arsenophonus sp.]
MILVTLLEHLHHKETSENNISATQNEDGVRGNDNGSNTENR